MKDTRTTPLVRRVGRRASVRRSDRCALADRRNVRRSFPARVAVADAFAIWTIRRPTRALRLATALPAPGTEIVTLARRPRIVKRLSDENAKNDDATRFTVGGGGG
ncbi:MAG TPA: hypothetical protein VF526_09150, partial [Solirubrobacteraceae bacterium]